MNKTTSITTLVNFSLLQSVGSKPICTGSIQDRKEKAIRILTIESSTLWIPLSICKITDVVDNHCDIIVPKWFLTKNNIGS